MEVKSNKVSQLIYYIYFLLVLLSSTISFFSNKYSKYSLMIQSFLLLLLFLFNQKEIIKDKKNFFLVMFLLMFSLISVLASDGGIGSLLNLFHFLGGVLIFRNMNIDSKMQNFVYYICIVLWIFNIRLSFNAWKLHVLGESIYNPNGIGIFIFITTVILKSYINKLNFKAKGVLTILFFSISTYCIYLTNCRSALIAMLFYLLCSYVPIVDKFIFKHGKLLLYVIVIIGIMFPKIYVNMYINNVNFEVPYMEKNLYTGREYLWFNMYDALENEKTGYLFGMGTNYYTKFGVINNFHNWYLGVMYTFGAPIFIMYYFFLIDIFSKANKKEILYGLMALFVIGFSETLGLWIGTQVYIFMCIIAQKSIYKEVNKNDNYIYTNI